MRERLEQEADEVAADRPLQGADFPRLRYAQAVLKELLRVQPPALTLVSRPALEDTTLAGYAIPRGTVMQIPAHVLHTRADYWERTDEFWPERWLSDSPHGASGCPIQAFVPFSREPRACRGAPFATVLMVLTIAAVARKFRLEPVVKEIPKRMSADVGFFDGPILATVEGRDQSHASGDTP